MKSFNEIKKDIKKIGYSIKLNNYSWGKSVVYKHDASNDSLTYNVCSNWEKWQALKEYLLSTELECEYFDENGNKIYGIVPKVFKEI